MEAEEKQWLMGRADHKPGFWVSKAARRDDLSMSGLRHLQVEGSRRGRPDRFSWFVDGTSLVVFLSGSHSNRHEDGPNTRCGGERAHVYIQWPSF